MLWLMVLGCCWQPRLGQLQQCRASAPRNGPTEVYSATHQHTLKEKKSQEFESLSFCQNLKASHPFFLGRGLICFFLFLVLTANLGLLRGLTERQIQRRSKRIFSIKFLSKVSLFLTQETNGSTKSSDLSFSAPLKY